MDIEYYTQNTKKLTTDDVRNRVYNDFKGRSIYVGVAIAQVVAGDVFNTISNMRVDNVLLNVWSDYASAKDSENNVHLLKNLNSTPTTILRACEKFAVGFSCIVYKKLLSDEYCIMRVDDFIKLIYGDMTRFVNERVEDFRLKPFGDKPQNIITIINNQNKNYNESHNEICTGTPYTHFKFKAVYIVLGIVHIISEPIEPSYIHHNNDMTDSGRVYDCHTPMSDRQRDSIVLDTRDYSEAVIYDSIRTQGCFVILQTEKLLLGESYVYYMDPLTNLYYIRKVDDFFEKIDYSKYPDVENKQVHRFEVVKTREL